MTRQPFASLAGAFLAAGCLVAGAPAASAQSPAETIRVVIAQNESEVDLQVRGRFTVHERETGESLHSGRQLQQVAVKGSPQGLLLGERLIASPAVRVESRRDADINVNGRHLRGAIEISRDTDMKLRVINVVPLEDYLRGVLSKEAPDHWPKEALKAIAIAARTYAVYQRLTKTGEPFDVRADVLSQDYGGRSSEKRATTRAVKDSDGLILIWQGKVFPAFYHSTCGGKTEHGRVMGKYDLAPLAGGVSCHFCAASPFYSWQRRLTRADINWALHKSPHGSIGAIEALRVASRTPTGRVDLVEITGAKRALKMKAYDLRALFGFTSIRSPSFTVEPAGDDFVLDGHGWGHGVGLCQWGAAELARRGLTAAEILGYYYRGAELVRLGALEHLDVVTGG